MFEFLSHIDWVSILTPVLQVLLSTLATALVGYFVIIARTEWVKFQTSQPDVFDKIQAGANWAYGAVQQLRKTNYFPTDQEAKAYAEALVDKYLKAKGVNIDLTPFYEIISASIEKAIDDNRNTVVTTSVAKVESTPSKVVAPVKTSVKVAKNAAVEVSLPEIPSVVTTTTSVVSNSSSDSVAAVLAETPTSNSTDGSVG